MGCGGLVLTVLRFFCYPGGGRRFFGFKKFFGKLFEISGRLIFWGLGLFFERSKPSEDNLPKLKVFAILFRFRAEPAERL